jgi:hypothetical protein
MHLREILKDKEEFIIEWKGKGISFHRKEITVRTRSVCKMERVGMGTMRALESDVRFLLIPALETVSTVHVSCRPWPCM